MVEVDPGKEPMLEVGAEPVGNMQAEMASQIRKETEKSAGLVKAGRIIVE